MINIIEGGPVRIPHLHKEEVIKTTVAVLTATLPISILVGREIYSRRKEGLIRKADEIIAREDALQLAKDSVNSGDSKFDFK